MLFSLRGLDGSFLYLLRNRTYSVGRKDCDILITNDQSISRKHAILTVKDDKVILCDCGSRYNTFVDNAKIKHNVEVMLKRGNVIQFGMLKSIYTFEETNLVTTTSNIKSEQRLALKTQINFLGGSFLQNWNSQCTHVTVDQIMLTVKVLCAVITGMPIVKLKYWEDYVDCVKQNLTPPNCADYNPPCSESVLNCQKISLEYKQERKSLFKNKVFVFPSEQEKAKMVDMIKLAGGEAISWDHSPISKTAFKDSSKEYLILVTDVPPSETLTDIINYINELGKRAIPLQEIALAIISGSCEKDCNPSFDRKGIVFAMKTQTDTQKNSVNVLAQETQSQVLFPLETDNVKTEIIPQSLENDLDANVCVVGNTQNVTVEPSESLIPNEGETLSIKREGDSIENSSAAKKMKIEQPLAPLFTKSSKQKNDITTSFETVGEPSNDSKRATGKSLFAFKSDKSNNQNTNPEPKSVVVNPFARKRKTVQTEDTENPPKKPAAINETLTLLSSPSTSTSRPGTRLHENPFANILKSKNVISMSQSSSEDKSRGTTKKSEKIASSTVIHENVSSLEIDFSAIERIDSTLEKSFGWISKSGGNNHTASKHTSLRANGAEDSIDQELLKYIESFRNTVVVSEESLIVRKPTVIDNNTSVSNTTLKNFKTFKKVQPLRMQTKIYPESGYIDIVCNEKCSIPAVQEDSEDENVIDTQVNAGKRKGKRFDF